MRTWCELRATQADLHTTSRVDGTYEWTTSGRASLETNDQKSLVSNITFASGDPWPCTDCTTDRRTFLQQWTGWQSETWTEDLRSSYDRAMCFPHGEYHTGARYYDCLTTFERRETMVSLQVTDATHAGSTLTNALDTLLEATHVTLHVSQQATSRRTSRIDDAGTHVTWQWITRNEGTTNGTSTYSQEYTVTSTAETVRMLPTHMTVDVPTSTEQNTDSPITWSRTVMSVIPWTQMVVSTADLTRIRVTQVNGTPATTSYTERTTILSKRVTKCEFTSTEEATLYPARPRTRNVDCTEYMWDLVVECESGEVGYLPTRRPATEEALSDYCTTFTRTTLKASDTAIVPTFANATRTYNVEITASDDSRLANVATPIHDFDYTEAASDFAAVTTTRLRESVGIPAEVTPTPTEDRIPADSTKTVDFDVETTKKVIVEFATATKASPYDYYEYQSELDAGRALVTTVLRPLPTTTDCSDDTVRSYKTAEQMSHDWSVVVNRDSTKTVSNSFTSEYRFQDGTATLYHVTDDLSAGWDHQQWRRTVLGEQLHQIQIPLRVPVDVPTVRVPAAKPGVVDATHGVGTNLTMAEPLAPSMAPVIRGEVPVFPENSYGFAPYAFSYDSSGSGAAGTYSWSTYDQGSRILLSSVDSNRQSGTKTFAVGAAPWINGQTNTVNWQDGNAHHGHGWGDKESTLRWADRPWTTFDAATRTWKGAAGVFRFSHLTQLDGVTTQSIHTARWSNLFGAASSKGAARSCTYHGDIAWDEIPMFALTTADGQNVPVAMLPRFPGC